MATLNKTVSGYINLDGVLKKTDIVLKVNNSKKGKCLSLATYAGLVLTAPLTKEMSIDLIKALGE